MTKCWGKNTFRCFLTLCPITLISIIIFDYLWLSFDLWFSLVAKEPNPNLYTPSPVPHLLEVALTYSLSSDGLCPVNTQKFSAWHVWCAKCLGSHTHTGWLMLCSQQVHSHMTAMQALSNRAHNQKEPELQKTTAACNTTKMWFLGQFCPFLGTCCFTLKPNKGCFWKQSSLVWFEINSAFKNGLPCFPPSLVKQFLGKSMSVGLEWN